MRGNLARFVAALVIGVGVSYDGVPAWVLAQQPAFRSAVDLIALDVQVVDGRGNPVAALRPDQFEVTIDRRRRRVLSAEFLRADVAPRASADGAPQALQSVSSSALNARTVVVAIDTASFDVGGMRLAAREARRFIAALEPHDRVGLYAYPQGPDIEPTTDRVRLGIELGRLVGHLELSDSRFNLRPSEIVDITAEPGLAVAGGSGGGRGRTLQTAGLAANTITAVHERECPADPDCPSRILTEANYLALRLEGEGSRTLARLQSLLSRLSLTPGRKAVIILSAGVVSSDRPGGKPDLAHLAHSLGQIAAAANARVYTVQIEGGAEGQYSSLSRGSGGETRRDRDLRGVWLDEFSGLAGGALIRVPEGLDASAFDRILREMSAYYLLGVETDAADRDGRTHVLSVRVRQRGLTVRSRQWVIIPSRSS